MFANFFKRVAPTHFATPYKQQLDGTFNLYEARRGRGKSYAMAAWAMVAVRKNRPIIANFSLNHYWFAYEHLRCGHSKNLDAALDWCQRNIILAESWDDILVGYDCLILLDEVNRVFDAQDLSKDVKAPKVVFEWLQQSRKHQNTIVFAAQSMDWLTPRVKQLFDRLWRAKKEVDKKGRIKGFWAYGGDPWAKGLSAQTQRDADWKMFLPFDPKITRLYDTLEIIRALPPESTYGTFKQVEQFMLDAGIKPPPAPPYRRLELPDWWDVRRRRRATDRREVSTDDDEQLTAAD